MHGDEQINRRLFARSSDKITVYLHSGVPVRYPWLNLSYRTLSIGAGRPTLKQLSYSLPQLFCDLLANFFWKIQPQCVIVWAAKAWIFKYQRAQLNDMVIAWDDPPVDMCVWWVFAIGKVHVA